MKIPTVYLDLEFPLSNMSSELDTVDKGLNTSLGNNLYIYMYMYMYIFIDIDIDIYRHIPVHIHIHIHTYLQIEYIGVYQITETALQRYMRIRSLSILLRPKTRGAYLQRFWLFSVYSLGAGGACLLECFSVPRSLARGWRLKTKSRVSFTWLCAQFSSNCRCLRHSRKLELPA